jgi:hypothetical protein
MNTKLAFLLVPLLAACGNARSSVEAMKAPDLRYETLTCQQLADEQIRLSIAMTVESETQTAVRAADQQHHHDAITKMINTGCGVPTPIVASVN